MSQKVDKWCRWIEEIEKDLTQILIVRHYYHELYKIVNSNSRLHTRSQFYAYHEYIYLNTIISGVRRQLKSGGDSISLRGLLEDIEKNLSEITSQTYSASWTRPRSGAELFKKKFQDSKIDRINPDLVREWREKMAAKSSLVEKYADRKISHLDKRMPKQLPSLKDIDDALLYLEELCLELSLLVCGSCPEKLIPFMDDDWKDIFTVPWIDKSAGSV